MHTLRKLHLALGALLALGACHRSAPSQAPVPSAAPAASATRLGTLALPTSRTTSGSIAVGNLNAQIVSAQKAFARTGSVADGSGLADLLTIRAQFLGTLEDYDAALTISQKLVQEHLKDGIAHMALASALNSLHYFDASLKEIDVALANGADPQKAKLLKASTLLAMGRASEAADIFAAANAKRPTLRTLGDEAMARAEMGDFPRALNLFTQAFAHYRNVSPFAVAWVDFHAAMVEDKLGHVDEAMAFYGDAVARLPDFAAGQGHLAALEAATGKSSAALARLRGLHLTTDPEFTAQEAGMVLPAEAAPLIAQTKARFDALLAKHPEAFANHAARFWLGPGADPAKALALAQVNLKGRKTADAYELALEAALDAHDHAPLCALAKEAEPHANASVPLTVALERADEACGATEKAAALKARLRASAL